MTKLKIILTIFMLSTNSIAHAVLVDAKLDWADKQRLSFAVPGVVETAQARVGNKVEKGEVLARLDQRPFKYLLKHCQAAIKKLEPQVFDARLELNHAEELYERTVLSEVELQRIDGKHKALVAEQEMLEANCKIEKWKAEKSILKATQQFYILGSNIVPGMVISKENQHSVFIELASATQATAVSWISAEQKIQLKSSGNIEVLFGQLGIPATLQGIDFQPDNNGQYRAVFLFYYRQPVMPGKMIKVSF